MSKTPSKSTGNNSRHVIRQGRGWVVKKGGAERASSVHPTQAEAVRTAQESVRAKGGELRIQGPNGRSRASFTIGRDGFEKISAVEGIKLSRTSRQMFKEFDRKELSAEERRRAIIEKHTKPV